MTQLSGVAAAVEYQRYAFILGQITLHFVELAIRNADGTGNVPFVILGTLGSGINNHGLRTGLDQFFNDTGFNGIIVAGRALPLGKTVLINLDVGVTEFFRLPGGFVTQLSSGALAIEDQQGFLVFRQVALELVKLAVRNADG